MGEVKKQSIQNSIVQYIGIILGYFNSVILFTNILSTEEYGLTRVFFAISAIYVNFSSLGTFRSITRFFPFFRTDDRVHNGFFTMMGMICVLGFILATGVYISLESTISENYADSTSLYTDNYYYVVFLSFLMLLSNFLENHLMALKKTVLPHFLNNIGIRLLWIVVIVLYHYDFYNFNTFIFLFVAVNGVEVLVMWFYLYSIGEIKPTFEFLKLRKKVFRVVIKYGIFTVVTGFSTLLVNRIDTIMIAFLIGLSDTSIYSIAFYISSVVMVPYRSINRIAKPVVAEQWRKKKLDEMHDFYKKASINTLLTGGLVFLCIWVNIDQLFLMLPPEYAGGKWPVFFLSMGVLFNLVTGINSIIILNSNYYYYDTYASLALILMTITTNFIFIPIWGILGAAFATSLSVFAFHTYKYILILVKMKMQPFSIHTITGILAMLTTYFLVYMIPDFEVHYLINISIKCFVTGMLFLTMIRVFKISPEINEEIDKYLAKAGLKK